MFLRAYQKTKDGKKHTYYALVESQRTAVGPRQRIVAYLGELNHEQERRWQRTVIFHNRQGETQQLRLFPDDETVVLPDDPDLVRIRLSSVSWTNPRSFGDVWLARRLWQILHLDEIVARHVPRGKHTVAPADTVAIEVINRLCGPCSEWALAEHWYASTALPELLGVPDEEITKDRLYRTLDSLLQGKEAIENDLKDQFGTLFQLDYDLLLYDLTSTFFEGMAEANPKAQRGYSRDHRSDCKQIVLALVVTREGFPLAHFTLAGNTQDLQTVERIVQNVEQRFGRSQRVWVMDRGMISKKTLRFLNKDGRRYLLATRRSELKKFQEHLGKSGWQRLPDNPEVRVKSFQRRQVYYLLACSKPRRQKERAMRRKQRRGLAKAIRQLHQRVAAGRLRQRDKILEAVGRIQARYPRARPFVSLTVSAGKNPKLQWSWKIDKFKAALVADGAYLLRSNRGGWSPTEFWETYIQLTVVERAFRVLKSELWLRPVWHQISDHVEGHVMICVLAYALWKTLDHLAKRANLQTITRKVDPEHPDAAPAPRPMTPEVILRELAKIKLGDIHLETTEGQKLVLSRVARPDAEQARILAALKLTLPERLSPDRLL